MRLRPLSFERGAMLRTAGISATQLVREAKSEVLLCKSERALEFDGLNSVRLYTSYVGGDPGLKGAREGLPQGH
jgi:hypothetical protein